MGGVQGCRKQCPLATIWHTGCLPPQGTDHWVTLGASCFTFCAHSDEPKCSPGGFWGVGAVAARLSRAIQDLPACSCPDIISVRASPVASARSVFCIFDTRHRLPSLVALALHGVRV